MGFPIRRSPDQSLFAAPRGLSQRTTSFIASQRQGIHQMPFFHLIALITDVHPGSLLLLPDCRDPDPHPSSGHAPDPPTPADHPPPPQGTRCSGTTVQRPFNLTRHGRSRPRVRSAPRAGSLKDASRPGGSLPRTLAPFGARTAAIDEGSPLRLPHRPSAHAFSSR
ncbi:hypothetical protein SD80_027570 [Scytonema tolypothrichoides VB-61278]|nr:hypothetical protein SD80_027570 [Scytonema tolypothrichoides VB-61278]